MSKQDRIEQQHRQAIAKMNRDLRTNERLFVSGEAPVGDRIDLATYLTNKENIRMQGGAHPVEDHSFIPPEAWPFGSGMGVEEFYRMDERKMYEEK